jgi:hypothetical protein
MKDLVEVFILILLSLYVLAMCFVFSGTPSPWDRWHAQAAGEVVKCAPGPASGEAER